MSGYATHEVQNQPGELVDFNVFAADAALSAAMRQFGAGWAEGRLLRTGALVGSAHVRDLARAANRYVPELRTHDRFGNRIDEVEFHPSWHELMGLLRKDEVHSLGWTAQKPGAHVARAGLSYLWAQGEPGVGCPAVMTFASIAALKHQPELLAKYRDRILSPEYDPRPLPPAAKKSLGVAMALTEKQGGSDLRQTQTVAVPAGGATFLLTGHKWFFSVPTSDLFLTLARTQAGISCFLAQGWRDDGSRNFLLLQRLKEKCGNRSNASSEVEFRGLEAELVGEEGRGIATVLEMAHLTRIECALGSAALMRQAVTQAIHHAGHRTAFQKRLIDQPIMCNVLADLAIESEAALWLSLRAAAALDASASDERARVLHRVLAPIAKYWVCKRTPAVVAEALECHGGNGFIEDHVMARLYREAPLNGLWEGSGNVICLDVMRALAREPEAMGVLMAEIGLAKDRHPAMDAWLRAGLPAMVEANARRLVEHLALGVTASLLLRYAPPDMADAFCETRLRHDYGMVFGTLPEAVNQREVLRRHDFRGKFG
ncbi:MAG TPA: acyl-CoA dehydrogenase family protein [Acidocella sp.]|nr:acyl-CoA dehydrogenase family protein [Acidocella sp.]